MKILNKVNVLLLFVAILLTACSKENIDQIVVEDPNFQPEKVDVNPLTTTLRSESNDGGNLECITVDFPFSFMLESGNTLAINSTDELKAATNEAAQDKVVDFVFPLSITDKDGTSMQIENNLALGTNFASCIPTTGWATANSTGETLPAFLLEDLCFDIVYPVNLEDEDGNAYIANNAQEFIDFSATINPLFFTLPLTVVDADGNEIAVETLASFFDLVYDCDGISPPVSGYGIVIQGFGCNQLVYPFDVAISDGSIVTVNNEDEYANLILSGETLDLQFPFSVENADGEITVINNIDDVIAALEECGLLIEINPVEGCGITPAHILLFFNTPCGYSINFPLQVEAEGVTYDINNWDDYFAVYNMYSTQVDKIELLYPASVTLNSGGVVSFDSDDAVCAFISDC